MESTSKFTTVRQLLKDVAWFVIGVVFTLFILFYVLMSIPLVFFRKGLKILAKYLRRDLGEIVGGASVYFIRDYFAATPPRCNVLLTLVLQGQITLETMKALVFKKWIEARDDKNGNMKYEKFQQYPVKWWGLVFWKWAKQDFSLDNHIKNLFPGQNNISEFEVTNAVEGLLNSRISGGRSPWEIHVVQNYQPNALPFCNDDVLKSSPPPSPPHSVIIIKFHHCLSDGYGMVKAVLESLVGYHPVLKMKDVADRHFQTSTKEKFLHAATFPFRAVYELSQGRSRSLQKSPLKINDVDKAWYQVLAKSTPIPIKRVKDIKNAFQVSFTSVLMSALSKAMGRMLGESEMLKGKGKTVKNAVCFCVLPAPNLGKRKAMLANDYTGAVVNLPLDRCCKPEVNLQKVFQNLEKSKKSVTPFGLLIIHKVLGANLFSFYSRMGRNTEFPIVFANFASVPITEAFGGTVTSVDAVIGAGDGDAGVLIAVVGYGEELRIQVTAERSLMSQEEAEKFVGYITEEIFTLHDFMSSDIKNSGNF